MSTSGKGRRIKKLFLAAKLLWIVILAVTLAAGFIFQAPWKVNTLLAILIVTPTIIPKPIRRYIYLTFALVLAGLAVWVFLPEDSEGWQPYVFKHDLAAFEAKLHVPDEANAAVIYNRLMEGYDYDASDLAMLQCLPDDASDDLRYFLEFQAIAGPKADLEQTMAGLLEAAQLDKCRFKVSYSPLFMDEQYHRFTAVKMWARFLDTSAALDASSGNPGGGLAKHMAMLRISHHLYQQGTCLDFLVGAAIQGMAISGINALVMAGQLSPEQIQATDSTLASSGFDWQANLPRLMDYEKLYTKHMGVVVYETNDKGAIRHVRPDRHFPATEANAQSGARTARDKLAAIVVWFVWPPPSEISRIVEQNFAHCYEMADPNYAWPAEPTVSAKNFSLSMTSGLKPSDNTYRICRDIDRRAGAGRNGARILIRLQRHCLSAGGYPQSLDEVLGHDDFLSDPLVRAAFVYRREGEGFVLYHTGPNGADDAGIRDRLTGADDVLIWPLQR
ncbi:MAG: hypothetical protein IH624_02845 [Phycisphaerae bacterium]|nr:hypothetical protein [Phycisphaerae bacterium]